MNSSGPSRERRWPEKYGKRERHQHDHSLRVKVGLPDNWQELIDPESGSEIEPGQ